MKSYFHVFNSTNGTPVIFAGCYITAKGTALQRPFR